MELSPNRRVSSPSCSACGKTERLRQATSGGIPDCARSRRRTGFTSPLPGDRLKQQSCSLVIWKIESQVWNQFLPPFGTRGSKETSWNSPYPCPYSLGQLIGYCEDLALKINIYGLYSLPGLARTVDLRSARLATRPVCGLL